ncbi:hypothetical protein CC78DRAFT_107591 [Lojkania enalia]|uniref:RING-type domain-containing protein n=1 Tax=Lojkania enalia TaxID=147567 RepID=A0A9P4N234_9PLEO|nr:hypothetical protein CC78DRAFT_107591 [Didymosphaeria enalia]
MAHHARGQIREVIDLLSDDEDNDADYTRFLIDDILEGDRLDSNFGNAIDLTENENLVNPVDLTTPNAAGEEEGLSEAECLQTVLTVFPDISVNHVLGIIQEKMKTHLLPSAECERIIASLLDKGPYPTEADEAKTRKRKRTNEDDNADYENGGHVDDVSDYYNHALDLLKDEFLSIPVRHLEVTLKKEKSIFKAVPMLHDQLRNYSRASSSFTKINKPRQNRFTESRLALSGHATIKELHTARNKVETENNKRRKEEENRRAEEENLLQAQLNGEMNECQCCFDEFPLNRMVCCNGSQAHFLCTDCASKAVEAEMSNGRCRPKCFADTACGGTYSRQQLQGFLDVKSFDRLERMQQQEDLAAAGLDLDECPFCDFKQECPPIEVDREFRCLNPKCGKTSCRLCFKESHIPRSCDEAKKDSNITVRHQLEEAMTDAIIRKCNRCKNPFVKEYGCNKMTCTKCGNVQCYVCSKDVKDYNHFGSENSNTRCPLHDNVEVRHEQEAKKAETEALARLRAEHPDIPEEELKIQVSDRVKSAEEARRGNAQNQHAQFPWHMNNGVLMPGAARNDIAPLGPQLAPRGPLAAPPYAIRAGNRPVNHDHRANHVVYMQHPVQQPLHPPGNIPQAQNRQPHLGPPPPLIQPQGFPRFDGANDFFRAPNLAPPPRIEYVYQPRSGCRDGYVRWPNRPQGH